MAYEKRGQNRVGKVHLRPVADQKARFFSLGCFGIMEKTHEEACVKTVQLKVDDSRLELLLTIIKNLKKDLVQEISVENNDAFSIPTVSDEENQYYENVLHNMSADDKTVVSEKSFTI